MSRDGGGRPLRAHRTCQGRTPPSHELAASSPHWPGLPSLASNGPHLYASSWPIHRSLLALLTLRPALPPPPPPPPHTHPSLLLHPWPRSGLCHNRPLPSSHPGKPVGGVQLLPSPVLPAQVSPLSLGLQAADGGAAPSRALVTRGSTGLSQTLEVRPPGGARHPTGVPSTLFTAPPPP